MSNRRPWWRVSKLGTLTIVLSVLAVFALGGMVACAGLVFWGIRAFSRDLAGAQVSANEFFDEIHAGRIDAAYQRTTVGFREEQSLNDFRQFVKKNSILKTYTSRKTEPVFTRRRNSEASLEPTATVQTILTEPGNSKSFTLLMKKENHRWKVEKIYVPLW